ncbi:MAG: bifunctional histidinol-phosphatase/imidazoleglycerol-phosphate dehydratase [Gammaproteobacteria bacterium]|nr:bifunctional histidinol-phosphatase/imidazoleglycerol-phosphate dehydratase [Gammaproteobacteria bacterium]
MNVNKNILFIDRDGTIIEEPEDFQVDTLEKIKLVPNVIPSLIQLSKYGFHFVMVSNQDGIGNKSYPKAAFELCQKYIMDLLNSQGIEFDEIFICPHMPDEDCTCRKPKTGLLTRYLASTNINTKKSAVIGDRATDMEFADEIGIRGILTNSKSSEALSWPEIVTLLCHSDRTAIHKRETNETKISAEVNLDSTEKIKINTGIGFYDHMLEQIAKHGGFSLTLLCDGDLEIDEHHTIEDTAICLGKTLKAALGSKIGIGRYGFLLPMDESEAKVSLDLSGRSAFNFSAEFPRNSVGEMPTEMVEHFFRSLSESLGASLHIDVKGENTHHMIEACFKSVGRALRQAIQILDTELPSTKGTLSG